MPADMSRAAIARLRESTSELWMEVQFALIERAEKAEARIVELEAAIAYAHGREQLRKWMKENHDDG